MVGLRENKDNKASQEPEEDFVSYVVHPVLQAKDHMVGDLDATNMLMAHFMKGVATKHPAFEANEKELKKWKAAVEQTTD